MTARRIELGCFAACALMVVCCVFYRYGDIPFGLFSDETAIGYDGECVLHTLRDSYGTFLPLNFRSLEDYKSPIAVYTAVATVGVLGPTTIAARLPSALFLLGAAVALFFLLRRLTGRPVLSRWMAALFLTIPSIFFYAHLSPFAEGDSYVLTFVLALIAVERFDRLPAKSTAFLAGAAIGFCTYAYTTARLGAPLLLAVTALIFFLVRSHRRFVPWLVAGGALLGLPEAAYMLLHPGMLTKRFGSVSVFARSDSVSQVIHRIVDSYAVYLGSFDFLFRNGQHNDWSNAGLGFLPVWLFAPWAAGFVVLWLRRTRPMARLMLVTWFLSPIPAALTYEVPPWFPHTTRALLAAPIALIFGAIAIGEALDRATLPRAALVAAVAFVGLETVQGLNQFFNVYAPRYQAQGGFDGGHSQALSIATAHRKRGNPLYLTPPLYGDALMVAYFANVPQADYRTPHFDRHAIFQMSENIKPPPGAIVVLEGKDTPSFAFEELGRVSTEAAQPPLLVVYRAL